MSRRPIWEELYKRFDPFRPADNPAWRADRVRSPANEIVRLVGMPFGDTRVLITGTTGTGKSTELLRIAEARSGKDFVVVLDLQRHFSEVVGDEGALPNVSSWEVVFLAGLAVVRAASEILPYPIPPAQIADLSSAWEKVAKATDTPRSQGAQIDAGSLAKTMVVTASAALPLLGASAGTAAIATAGLTVLKAAAEAVKWTLPIGQSARRRPDQDVEMQTLLNAVNAIIGYVQTKATRILLLIDGLDRIVELDRAEALFLRSEMIAQLACRVVVCGPFSIRSHPAAGAIPRFSEVSPLENEPVMDHEDPRKPGPGITFFRELYLRRAADLGALDLLSEERLHRLSYYSGGRARDFVKSIRMLAEQGWLDDAPTATDALVDKVLDKARRLLETGLDKGHIHVLEEAMADPLHYLPDNNDNKARELLKYGLLLPYPNESEWYYPHPLLTVHLLRPRATSSSGSG